MSFKILKCEDSFIDSFCDILKGEGYILSSLSVGLDSKHKGLKGKVLVVSYNDYRLLFCFGCILYRSKSILGALLFSDQLLFLS